MASEKITEQPGPHRHLEQRGTGELLRLMNEGDAAVAATVADALSQVEALAEAAIKSLSGGGRLFYCGAGSSGRLAVLDAAECPPTFGVSELLVTAVIAGGGAALTAAVEGAEDDGKAGWHDLQEEGIGSGDILVGISASGSTPYVLGALKAAGENGIVTGCIVSNPGSPIAALARFPVEVVAGPEFVTGSTRLKAGTAQKMVLNLLSTTVMIRLGRVEDNRMVNLQLTNEKLLDRGTKMILEKSGSLDYTAARALLIKHGNVKAALNSIPTG